MASYDNNSWWGLFEDKNKASYFYVPYFRFDSQLKKDDLNSKFIRFVFFRDFIFYSYLATELNEGRIVGLYDLYQSFLGETRFLSRSSPPYQVFKRDEFHEFVLKNFPKLLLDQKKNEFVKILNGFAEAIKLIVGDGLRNATSILKLETVILDSDVKFEDLKLKFDRDVLIFISKMEI